MRYDELADLSDDVVIDFLNGRADRVFDRVRPARPCVTMQFPRKPSSGAPPYVS